jgi:Mrp family chromosome partitioning ATPase
VNSTTEDLQQVGKVSGGPCTQKQQTVLPSSMPLAIYESFSTLIQRLYVSANGSPVRTVVVTAVHPESGVSYVSSCLSTLLAEKFGTTLLVDGHAVANLARRRVVPMRSDCSSVRRSRLSVLGKAKAAEIVDHTGKKEESFQFVIESLLHEFEYVIVDAPALSVSRVAQALSPHVDGVLLVVVPNQTDIGDICSARQKLVSTGGHLLGAIYNTTLDHSGATTGPTPCND